MHAGFRAHGLVFLEKSNVAVESSDDTVEFSVDEHGMDLPRFLHESRIEAEYHNSKPFILETFIVLVAVLRKIKLN